MIGAGVGAMAAAARLATVGHRVTVCERSGTHGGAVGTFSRDGFSFDTGPALLALPAVYRDLFLKTGKEPLEECVDLREVDPASHHLLPGGTSVALANASRAAVVQALDAALGAGAGARWSALLDRARVVWEATRRPLLEEPSGEGPDRVVHDPYPAPRWPVPGRGRPTLERVARRELRHPGLVALLDGYALRYGFDPRTAPASLVALPYLEHTFGTWYVAGGVRALADALFRRCALRGVEFRFDAEVVAVERTDGRATGVRLADGDRLPADAVVSGVPALAPLLGEAPPPGARTWPGRLSVLLALRGARPDGTPHRTLVHAPDRTAELTAVFDPPQHTRGPAAGPPRTVEVLRPDDAGLRPDGHEAVTLRVTVPPQGVVDWTADGLADAYADQAVRVAEAAVPGLRDRVLWRHVLTPADTERTTGAPGGGCPGPVLAGHRGAFLSADNRTSVPGLYRVGGWAHPGGGLPHTGMSGALVAGLIGTP